MLYFFSFTFFHKEHPLINGHPSCINYFIYILYGLYLLSINKLFLSLIRHIENLVQFSLILFFSSLLLALFYNYFVILKLLI